MRRAASDQGRKAERGHHGLPLFVGAAGSVSRAEGREKTAGRVVRPRWSSRCSCRVPRLSAHCRCMDETGRLMLAKRFSCRPMGEQIQSTLPSGACILSVLKAGSPEFSSFPLGT